MRRLALLACCLLSNAIAAGGQERVDLVVVLDGQAPDDPYYRAAALHYRSLDARVISGVGSLAELRTVLESAADDGLLGVVRLVVHGSEWTGLAVPVVPGGAPARPDVVRDALRSRVIAPLSDDVVDAETRFVLESCGLGRRPRFLADLAALWGGTERPLPGVQASEQHVAFGGIAGEATWRAERNYRSVVVPGAASGDMPAIAQTFARRYPDQPDLASAVAQGARLELRPMSFRVDVGDGEAIEEAGDLATWLRLQPALLSRLASAGLTARQLEWHREGSEVVGRATLAVLVAPSVPDAAM